MRETVQKGAGEREAEVAGCRVEPGQTGVEGHYLGKLLTPERFSRTNRAAITARLANQFGIS